jgi:hypothetical protein
MEELADWRRLAMPIIMIRRRGLLKKKRATSPSLRTKALELPDPDLLEDREELEEREELDELEDREDPE